MPTTQNLKSDEAQVAQQQATGRLQVHPRAVRRPARHPPGRSRPVSEPPARRSSRCRPSIRSTSISTLPQQALAQIKVGQTVTARSRHLSRRDVSPARSPPSTPRWTPPRATSRCGPTLKNPEHKLLPGMFATVEIDVGTPQRYVTLPQTAITFNPYGSTVYHRRATGQERRGPADARGAPDLRHHRRDARRPDRGAHRRQGRATPSSPPARSSCTTARS